MDWTTLAANRVPNTAAVADAIGRGILYPTPLWDIPGPPPATRAWTRRMFEDYIQHDDMSGSGISMNRLMTRAEMEAYAWEPVLVPQGFSASHHMASCPVYRIDLSWDNAGRIEAKRLEWSPDGVTWHVLDDQIPASATSYTHEGGPTPPVEGMNRYRIRFVSESQWAQAQIVALCPI